jgi:hypothetical protein
MPARLGSGTVLGMSIVDEAAIDDVAAKMRQVAFDANMVPSEAAVSLAIAVIRHRPWRDEATFGAALRNWADEHWWEGALEPRLADGAAEVAAELAIIGRASNPPSDAEALGIVHLMLRNVSLGRGPREYDTLRDHIKGVPARTLRRYRQRARRAQRDPGLDALPLFLESLQYRLDLGALVRGGRTEPAARRWLQRNPSRHASDAPPPRQRGGR